VTTSDGVSSGDGEETVADTVEKRGTGGGARERERERERERGAAVGKGDEGGKSV
jgi:hypothetical protein